MKNLDFALKVMAFTSQPMQFTVYGPKEDNEYWNECVELISALPRHVSVTYGGQVSADDVPSFLMEQDVFFLPTRGENFGHALVEAWEAGLPVLTSDQTPWRDLAAKGVGWDLPLDGGSLTKFAERLDALARCPAASFTAMRDRAIQFGAAITDNTVAIENNKQAFLAAMGSDESLI